MCPRRHSIRRNSPPRLADDMQDGIVVGAGAGAAGLSAGLTLKEKPCRTLLC
jgi:hypothetical protein